MFQPKDTARATCLVLVHLTIRAKIYVIRTKNPFGLRRRKRTLNIFHTVQDHNSNPAERSTGSGCIKHENQPFSTPVPCVSGPGTSSEALSAHVTRSSSRMFEFANVPAGLANCRSDKSDGVVGASSRRA